MIAVIPEPTARLSAAQCAILCRLLAHEQRAAGENGPHCVPIRALRGPGPKSRTDSAAFSRTVRRLAWRGLVVLCNLAHGIRSGPNRGKVRIDPADKNARADHLVLTEEGRKVAARIAAERPIAPLVQNGIALAALAPTQRAGPHAADGCAAPVTPHPAPRGKTCEFDERPALPDQSLCKECWEGLQAARGFKQSPTKSSPPSQPTAQAPARCQFCNQKPPGRPDCPLADTLTATTIFQPCRARPGSPGRGPSSATVKMPGSHRQVSPTSFAPFRVPTRLTSMFRQERAAGCSYREIARRLDWAGTACRGKQWSPSTVRAILSRGDLRSKNACGRTEPAQECPGYGGP